MPRGTQAATRRLPGCLLLQLLRLLLRMLHALLRLLHPLQRLRPRTAAPRSSRCRAPQLQLLRPLLRQHPAQQGRRKR